jgi:hypothetical protein
MNLEGSETEALRGGDTVLGAPQLQALLIDLNGSGKRYGFDGNATRERLQSWDFIYVATN